MLAAQQWKAAQAHLAEAAQAFLSACQTLDKSVSGVSDDSFVQEKMIFEVYSNRSGVESTRNSLAASYAIVNRILNMSAKHVPINTLLPETITQLFLFATASSVCNLEHQHESINTLSVITRVCSRWRQIAIANSSFWSHIDINLVLPLKGSKQNMLHRVKLWLERTHSMPLHLHVMGHTHIPEWLVSEALSTIAPYSPYIRSITLADGCNIALARTLFSQCARLCPEPLNSISVFDLISTQFGNTIVLPLGHFRNLIHLKVESCPLDFGHFLTMLSNNNSLRSLYVRDVGMSTFHARNFNPVNIALPNLELLDLVGTSRDKLSTFLSSLSLGPRFVEIRLGIPTNADFFEMLRSFAQRTNPVSLYLRLNQYDLGQVPPLLISLIPSIRVVFLELQQIRTGALDLRTLTTSVVDRLATHSQNLHTVGLISSDIDGDKIGQLAQLPGSGPQRQIFFINCEPDLPEDISQILAPSIAREIHVTEHLSESKTWLSLVQGSASGRIG